MYQQGEDFSLSSEKIDTVLIEYFKGSQPTARQGILPGPQPFIVIRYATFFLF